MRSGASSSPSAAWISSSAWLRVVRSLARLVLCSTSAWPALRADGLLEASACRRAAAPGSSTRLPRSSLSSASIVSASGGQRGHQDLARDRRRRRRRRRAGAGSPRPARPVPPSSTRSATQPRWPRIRPPRT